MELRKYTKPDFTEERFISAPEAVFKPAPFNGVAPDNFHAMSIFPEYFKVGREWLLAEDEKNAALYAAEVVIYAQNRTGLLVDISRTLTERKIDIGQMSVRTNKQGVATLEMSFSVHSKDELSAVIRELRKIQNVVDVTRKTG